MSFSSPIRALQPIATYCRPVLNQFSPPRILSPCQRRHESSRRRHNQRLRIPPAPSFQTGVHDHQQDHIVFNPPSSSPTVYHTPPKFLPKNDPRRAMHAAMTAASRSTPVASSARTTSTVAATRAPATMPPPLKPLHRKKYHLTEEHLAEMRELRAADPRRWTRKALAEKFECSDFFVGLVCQSAERKAEHERALAEVKSRWGPRRKAARGDRVRRKETWGRNA